MLRECIVKAVDVETLSVETGLSVYLLNGICLNNVLGNVQVTGYGNALFLCFSKQFSLGGELNFHKALMAAMGNITWHHFKHVKEIYLVMHSSLVDEPTEDQVHCTYGELIDRYQERGNILTSFDTIPVYTNY